MSFAKGDPAFARCGVSKNLVLVPFPSIRGEFYALAEGISFNVKSE